MKYYACDKNHWWYCADNKQLRKNHFCRHGPKIRCNKLLKFKGNALPPRKREEKPPKPEALSNEQLEDDLSGIGVNSNAPTVNYTEHYQCTSSVKQHYWMCTSRIDRPASAHCPAKVLPFNTPCGKPLESLAVVLPDLMSFQPLDASQFQQPSFVSHTYAQPSTSTLDYFEQKQPRKYEAQSQSDLTTALTGAGIALLCRDGVFRSKPVITSSDHQQAHVDEPGITRFGPLFATVTTSQMAVIGRLETGKHAAETYIVNPFIAGNVTYPDFTVEQNGQKFAVELKTPNTGTMTQYIAGSFYKETTSWGRPVEEEISKRAGILPNDYLQMLAFDLCNLSESFQHSVAALQDEIRQGQHKTFWAMIKGFLFIDSKRQVTSYSKDQFLALHTSQTTLGFVTTPSLIVNTTANTTTTNSNNQQETT